MWHSTASRRARQIDSFRRQFAQADGLPFADLLSADRLRTALAEENASWREAVWTPVLTLWSFLSQVISPDGSCRRAVCSALAWLASHGEPACSPQTGPYCKARQRLPESLLRRLTRQTARDCHESAAGLWYWKGRPVKLVDGTTVSMPDTPANQRAYPQPPNQRPGLGFPIARMVVVFCLATGVALDAALGRYRGKEQGENSLLRTLPEAFEPGDVLLADRCYSGWFDLAYWRERRVDVVTRLHQCRSFDGRRGRRLGRDDHVVSWAKPARPEWMDERTYRDLPAELELREVRVRVVRRGYRTRALVVVTTLTDARADSAGDLAELYRARWNAELDLRSLKSSMGMDVLRCKSPGMVRKEVWAHLLAYNLIRGVMAQAARDLGIDARELSFQGARQAIGEFAQSLAEARGRRWDELYEWLLVTIGAYQVGGRPGRVEPRARKRRPKSYPLLTTPREQARSQEIRGR